MKAPICRVCGLTHWGRCQHLVDRIREHGTAQRAQFVRNDTAMPVTVHSPGGSVVAQPGEVVPLAEDSKLAPGDDVKPADLTEVVKFDKRAYQREYMRKRRAAGKK